MTVRPGLARRAGRLPRAQGVRAVVTWAGCRAGKDVPCMR